MFRANRTRGEDSPTVLETAERHSTSFESLLALSLCAVVTLASVAFLRRSSALTRALVELQQASLHEVREHPRASTSPGVQPRPEIVLVLSLEALRPDHLELYGYERETAPNLRALGESGVVFDTVVAQAGHALASHKSLLTGKYPATLMLEETGADLLELSNLEDPRGYMLRTFSAVEGTLAEAFRARGFHTAGFTDGGWTSREHGFAPGFEVFDDAGGGLAANVPRALAWLENHGAHPAFLFLHAGDLRCPFATHEPFESTFCHDHGAHLALNALCAEAGARSGDSGTGELDPAERTALGDHYDSCLLATDAELGHLFEGLRTRGLYEQALIVVTAPHGESLGERGRVGHGGLTLAELRVPLVVKLPASWNQRPTRVTEPVELVDVLPTLLALCALPAQGDIDGRSLLPTLFRGVRGRDHLVAQTSFDEGPERYTSPAELMLLRPGRWQVIHDVAHSRAEFFALESDPLALVPHPIAADELEPMLELLLERGENEPHALFRPARPAVFGSELEHELESLGYGAALLHPDGAQAGPRAKDDLR